MPDASMPPALRFMLAARRCELQGLEELARTCELVARLSGLIHALQRERGYSDLYLGRPDAGVLASLEGYTADSHQLEQQVRAGLELLVPGPSAAAGQARLFGRVAFVLYSLEELPGLRRSIREQRIAALPATESFTRIIGGLLGLVFDAADSALDPALTRALVAMFNFMQGKELAGQERATGVAGFATGYFSAELQARMAYLADGQTRCFEVFSAYAAAGGQPLWAALQNSEPEREVVRLRGLLHRTSAEARVAPELGALWFEVCTRRIDAMKQVEDALAAELRQGCQQSISQARAELENHRLLLGRLASQPAARFGQPLLFRVQDSPVADGVGAQMSRSLLDLLQEQELHLQQLEEELQEARSALQERKLVEQAKRLLMSRYQLSEQAAHERLQRSAMDHGKRLAEVASQLLEYARNSSQPV